MVVHMYRTSLDLIVTQTNITISIKIKRKQCLLFASKSTKYIEKYFVQNIDKLTIRRST